MSDLAKKEYLIGLMHEAIQRACKIGSPYDSNLTVNFVQAEKTLETLPDQQSQQALIISAARRQITQAERQTIVLIIGDDPITGQQMSHLVRIRLICTELLNLLTTMLERIQMTFQRPGLMGSKMTGA